MNETLIVADCIYLLANGLVIFSEDAKDLGPDGMEFDMRKSAVLQFIQMPSGESGIQAVRGSEAGQAFFAGRLKVSRAAILGTCNTQSLELLKNARTAVAKIEILGPRR